MATKTPDHKPSTTLIAGYDGSESAAAAVRWAATRTVADGGRLVVVCAGHPGLPRPAATARSARAKAGLEALWMVEDALVDADVDLVVADAAPAIALCRAAAEADADGIVVGRHHTGPFNGDIYCYLTHSSGHTVLLNRVGRRTSSDLGYADGGFNLTFDDSRIYRRIFVDFDGGRWCASSVRQEAGTRSVPVFGKCQVQARKQKAGRNTG